jgi:hypothetical protein
VYVAVTLVSAAVSIDPRESLKDSRQLWLFFMVPVVARFARGERAGQTVNVIIALGAAGALVGIVQYAMLGYDNDNHRPMGLLSHYMTYSGVLMLVTCAAASRLLFYADERSGPASRSRRCWSPSFSRARAMRGWDRSPRSLSCLARAGCGCSRAAGAVLVFVLAPASLKQRAYSIVDPNDLSNRDRIQMLTMGVHMVRDHPFFGVGPKWSRVSTAITCAQSRARVQSAFARHPCRSPRARAHRLAVWLWFVFVAGRDLFRH